MVVEESESSDEQEVFPSVNVTDRDRQKCSNSTITESKAWSIPRNYGFEHNCTIEIIFIGCGVKTEREEKEGRKGGRRKGAWKVRLLR